MKKIFFLFMLGTFALFSQNGDPKNEIKFNFLNTLVVASAEVGYEYLLDNHQSLDAEFLINDRMNYQSESGSRNFKTSSIKIGYNYYFGTNHANSGLYVNPFIKYRFGDFVDSVSTVNMNAFILGAGVGYKWNQSDKFVFGPYANIARNFGEETNNRFQSLEFNAGFSIGYRF
jgi:hypothetical protein